MKNIILATALLLVMLAIIQPTATSDQPFTTRIAGADRFATAVQISRQAYPDGVDTVYIANGTTMADALAISPLADGPILLVSADNVPRVVMEEIRRLNPDSVVILGGPVAVSDRVQAEIEAIHTRKYALYMLDKVNSARGNDLAMALDVNPTSTDWSRQMARSRTMYHNPDMSSQICCWRSLGENVGYSTLEGGAFEALDRIHTAFMQSDGHRKNIIAGRWDDVGIGIVIKSNSCPDIDRTCIWVTQNFRDRV